jgi:hypothetical protein
MHATDTTSGTGGRAQRRSDLLAWLALGWVAVAVALMAVVPMGESSVSGIDSAGVAYERTSHETLLETNGAGVLVVLAVPVVLVGLAVLGGRRRPSVRRAVGAVMLIGCLLGALSIGLFFLPAAVLVLASASVGPGAPPSGRQLPPPPPPPARLSGP